MFLNRGIIVVSTRKYNFLVYKIIHIFNGNSIQNWQQTRNALSRFGNFITHQALDNYTASLLLIKTIYCCIIELKSTNYFECWVKSCISK